MNPRQPRCLRDIPTAIGNPALQMLPLHPGGALLHGGNRDRDAAVASEYD